MALAKCALRSGAPSGDVGGRGVLRIFFKASCQWASSMSERLYPPRALSDGWACVPVRSAPARPRCTRPLLYCTLFVPTSESPRSPEEFERLLLLHLRYLLIRACTSPGSFPPSMRSCPSSGSPTAVYGTTTSCGTRSFAVRACASRHPYGWALPSPGTTSHTTGSSRPARTASLRRERS